jgi:cation transport regulator ChaC
VPSAEFVFGYGSLVALGHVTPTRAFHPDGFITDVRDSRRCWGVAMNNAVDVPGYKYYLDEHGHRPAVHVAFLDLRQAPGELVNGVCMPVGSEQLAALDNRERNYVRHDLTARCHLPHEDIRVWAYVGSAAGRRRFTTARARGRAAIVRTYREGVKDGFKRLGRAEYEACLPSLDPDGVPVLALSRHELASTTIGP